MHPFRRSVLKTSAAWAATSLAPVGVFAQSDMIETAKILTGFPAGGTVDALARGVADKLRGAYANTVLVENKPGAAGQLGVITLKESNPDGSVMLVTPSSMLSIYPFTYRKLQYKLEDVTPVSNGAYIHHAFGVGPAVPETVKTFTDFVAWARANPEKANFGSPGAGSMPHLIGILLSKSLNVDLKHVPYRGSVPGIQDLIGGQIPAFSSPIGDYLQYLKSGRLRLLAVSGTERSRFAPDVPTYREIGQPITVREWYGFFMPGKAKPEAVKRASELIGKALGHADFANVANTYGLDLKPSSSGALAELLRADAEEWKKIIGQIGFTADS